MVVASTAVGTMVGYFRFQAWMAGQFASAAIVSRVEAAEACIPELEAANTRLTSLSAAYARFDAERTEWTRKNEVIDGRLSDMQIKVLVMQAEQKHTDAKITDIGVNLNRLLEMALSPVPGAHRRRPPGPAGPPTPGNEPDPGVKPDKPIDKLERDFEELRRRYEELEKQRPVEPRRER